MGDLRCAPRALPAVWLRKDAHELTWIDVEMHLRAKMSTEAGCSAETARGMAMRRTVAKDGPPRDSPPADRVLGRKALQRGRGFLRPRGLGCGLYAARRAARTNLSTILSTPACPSTHAQRKACGALRRERTRPRTASAMLQSRRGKKTCGSGAVQSTRGWVTIWTAFQLAGSQTSRRWS
jgi:hypothetical protein